MHCRYNRPVPRISAGIALRKIASAAIDLSDGLAGDIQHLVKSSEVGATIELQSLPLSEALLSECSFDQAIEYALTSGDDYELCFTVPESKIQLLKQALKNTNCHYSRIGRITGGSKVSYLHNGERVELQQSGFQHFKSKADND